MLQPGQLPPGAVGPMHLVASGPGHPGVHPGHPAVMGQMAHGEPGGLGWGCGENTCTGLGGRRGGILLVCKPMREALMRTQPHASAVPVVNPKPNPQTGCKVLKRDACCAVHAISLLLRVVLCSAVRVQLCKAAWSHSITLQQRP